MRAATAVEIAMFSYVNLKRKFVELFACRAENVQIFFTDFLGLDEVYNRPGTSGSQNWSLRMPDNYEEVYADNLKAGKAFNFPRVLKLAIEARGKKFAEENAEIIKKLEGIM